VSNGDNDNPQKKGPDSGFPKFNFNNRVALITLLVLIVFFIFFFVYNQGSLTQEIAYSVFLNYLNQDMVEAVKIIDGYEIQGQLKGRPGEFFKTTIPYSDPELLKKLQEKTVQITGGPRNVSPLRVFIDFLPWVLGFFFIWFMFRQVQGSGNRAFSFGKSRAKRYVESSKKINFTDVAGQDEAKYELQEVVEFLKNPGKFAKMGARIPKGVLLVGMPGTGKTLLAKAVAGEAGVPFFSSSGSEFVEMFVGVGASRVRDLFKQAKEQAPCIVFIDEIDAVGRHRGAGMGGGNDEREQTLNQILVEMDGFESGTNVIVIAATNRPDILDPALLRPGRFDRKVVVDLPERHERHAILDVHARGKPLSEDTDLEAIAAQTPGLAGADLENLMNEAAILAARKDQNSITMQNLVEAIERVMAGPARKSRVITEKERRYVAYHEAGHAIVMALLDLADNVGKVSVISRGQALGYVMPLPNEEKNLLSVSDFEAQLSALLGGRAAEELVFEDITTGAENDLERVTQIAQSMITRYGMNESLGPMQLNQGEHNPFMGMEIGEQRQYSEAVARKIDKEVRALVDRAYARTLELLKDNMANLKLVAETLLEREVLEREDFEELLGLTPASA
jgi:cell division protease FtsH